MGHIKKKKKSLKKSLDSSNSWVGFSGSSAGKRIRLQCGRPQFDSWVGMIPQRRDRLPTPIFLGFHVAQSVKNLPAMWETWVWSLGWEDLLDGGGYGNSLKYCYQESPHWQRSLACCSPGSHSVEHDWVAKHSTEQSLSDKQDCSANNWNPNVVLSSPLKKINLNTVESHILDKIYCQCNI